MGPIGTRGGSGRLDYLHGGVRFRRRGPGGFSEDRTDQPRVMSLGPEDSSKYRIRVRDSIVGTLYESPDIVLTGGGWATNTNLAPKNYALTILYNNPSNTAAPWEKATLESAQIGIRPTGQSGVRATQMWALVEFDTSLQAKDLLRIPRHRFLTRRR